jgi:signal transduction histidine kinase
MADATTELERMGRLVDGLLTLIRAEAGAIDGNEDVALADLLERSHRNAVRRAGDRVVVLRNDVDGAEVRGSADVLRRLFDNLYDNAIKYTGAAGHITTTAGLQGGWATVEVSDDGIGIAAAELPRVFERFFRAGHARGAEGSGLGLAIVQRAVSLHGGQVSVTSAPGQGATFTVHLPVIPRP